MVVGAGEADRFLPTVLKRLEPLVDLLVVWGCSPDKKTEQLLASSPFVEYHRDDSHPWAEYQPEIKFTLLTKYVFPHKPDWIVSIDADEVFDRRVTRDTLEEMAGRGELAYTFYCVQLYDREDQMRVDGLWGGFRNVRFWKPLYDVPQTWLKSRLHCGLAPIYAYAYAADSEFAFKHYGYMRPEDREKKVARYSEHDPKGMYMTSWYYKSILDESPRLTPFNEQEFGATLRYQPKKPNEKKVVERYKNPMADIVYFQNQHGNIISTSDRGVIEQYRKNKKLTEILNVPVAAAKPIEAPVVKSEEAALKCEICGNPAKSLAGLKAHQRSHK